MGKNRKLKKKSSSNYEVSNVLSSLFKDLIDAAVTEEKFREDTKNRTQEIDLLSDESKKIQLLLKNLLHPSKSHVQGRSYIIQWLLGTLNPIIYKEFQAYCFSYIQKKSPDILLMYGYVQVLFCLELYKEVIPLALKIRNKKEISKKKIYLMLACSYKNSHNYPCAYDYFCKMLRLYPQPELLSQADFTEYCQAIFEYLDYWKKFFNSVVHQENHRCSHLKQWEQTLQNLSNQHDRIPPELRVAHKLHETYFHEANAQPADALRTALEVLEIDPKNYIAHRRIIALCLRARNHLKVYWHSKKILQENPLDISGRYFLLMAKESLHFDIFNKEDWMNLLDDARKENILQKNYDTIYRSLLMACEYDDAISLKEVYHLGQKYSSYVQLPQQALPPYDHSSHPKNPRLRIGYFAKDFYNSVIQFYLPYLLPYHNQEEFEIFCYYYGETIDEYTEEYKKIVGQDHFFHDLFLPPLIQKIYDDTIDILVEISGNTLESIGALERKPAPVQISWLGTPCSAHLSSIDYRFTDKRADPPENQKFCPEKYFYLPNNFHVYGLDPKSFSPLLQDDPPCFTNKYITFGSFNSIKKLSPTILRIWKCILQKQPHAFLMIQSQNLRDPDNTKVFQLYCQAEGLPFNQIKFPSFVSDNTQYFNRYNEADIALDPYPYSGTTTTFDSLWMGLPVITLVGDRQASRITYYILDELGLTEDLIAFTPEEYVEKSLRLSQDYQKIKFYKNNLRQMLKDSVFQNYPQFAKNMENAYQSIWKKHLSKTINL